MSENPVKTPKAKRAPKGTDSGGSPVDKRIINGVVAELKPQMEQTITAKVDKVFEFIKEELRAIRSEIKPQPTTGPAIDVPGLMKEVEKVIPGLSSMVQQNQLPPGLPSKSADGKEIMWGEQPSLPNAGQPQAQPQQGGQMNIAMLLQLLSNPGIQNLLGLGTNPNAQAALMAMQQFSQLAMQNAMADMQFGSMVRKAAMQNFVKQNPMLAVDAQQAINAENALIGKPIEFITNPKPPESSGQNDRAQHA